MGKNKKDKYKDCAEVMVPIDREQYVQFKMWCLQNGDVTIKETLHSIATKGIKEVIGDGK